MDRLVFHPTASSKISPEIIKGTLSTTWQHHKNLAIFLGSNSSNYNYAALFNSHLLFLLTLWACANLFVKNWMFLIKSAAKRFRLGSHVVGGVGGESGGETMIWKLKFILSLLSQSSLLRLSCLISSSQKIHIFKQKQNLNIDLVFERDKLTL